MSSCVRCTTCHAFINPFVTFHGEPGSSRNVFVCNLCGCCNDVPPEYGQSLAHIAALSQPGPVASRLSEKERREHPELCRISYEIRAPAPYVRRHHITPLMVFLVDVSSVAVSNGVLQACAEAIGAYIEQAKNPHDRIAIIGFNDAVHFFEMSPQTDDFHMYTVHGDASFVPVASGLLAHVTACRGALRKFLRLLPSLFSDCEPYNSGLRRLGDALLCCQSLVSRDGALVSIVLSGRPNCGRGSLAHRDDPSAYGSVREIPLLRPCKPLFGDLGAKMKMLASSCLDLYVIGDEYADMATLSGIASHSGGMVYKFASLAEDRPSYESFVTIMTSRLTCEPNMDAVARVRVPHELLKVTLPTGDMNIQDGGLIFPSYAAPDTSLLLSVAHNPGGPRIVGSSLFFQVSFLYTDCKKERVVRVTNVSLPVADSLEDIYRLADPEVVAALWARKAVTVALEPSQTRLMVSWFIKERIAQFGKHLRGHVSQGTVVDHGPGSELRDKLTALALGMQRSVAFRASSQAVVTTDNRVSAFLRLTNSSVDEICSFLYPKMYCLTDLASGVGDEVEWSGLDDSRDFVAGCSGDASGPHVTVTQDEPGWSDASVKKRLFQVPSSITSEQPADGSESLEQPSGAWWGEQDETDRKDSVLATQNLDGSVSVGHNDGGGVEYPGVAWDEWSDASDADADEPFVEYQLPAALPLSFANVPPHAVVVTDNGLELSVFVGPQAEPETIMSLFGVDSISEVPVQTLRHFAVREGDVYNERVRHVIAQLHHNRGRSLPMRFSLATDVDKTKLYALAMVESAVDGLPSMEDFIRTIDDMAAAQWDDSSLQGAHTLGIHQ